MGMWKGYKVVMEMVMEEFLKGEQERRVALPRTRSAKHLPAGGSLRKKAKCSIGAVGVGGDSWVELGCRIHA
jgi:hypothetical protein